jgi:thioredoxin-like negative regulator of GroEL
VHYIGINKAMKLNNAGKYEEAARLYKKALDKPKKKYYSPSMSKLEQLVSEHLANCYQHLSYKVRTDPKAQLRYLYPAVYYCPYEDEYQNELADAISQLGKDPKVAADRIALGDEAHEIGDDIAAIVEYRAALKIKDNPAVRQKLEALEKAIENSNTEEKSQEKKSRS